MGSRRLKGNGCFLFFFFFFPSSIRLYDSCLPPTFFSLIYLLVLCCGNFINSIIERCRYISGRAGNLITSLFATSFLLAGKKREKKHQLRDIFLVKFQASLLTTYAVREVGEQEGGKHASKYTWDWDGSRIEVTSWTGEWTKREEEEERHEEEDNKRRYVKNRNPPALHFFLPFSLLFFSLLSILFPPPQAMQSNVSQDHMYAAGTRTVASIWWGG